MFKKSAIVATAAAGLLAIGSPAFATSSDTDGGKKHYESNKSSETEIRDPNTQFGLINVNDVLSDNQINVCDVIDLNVVAILSAPNSGKTTCTNAIAENDG